ncbi:MAG: hypothetical protein Q9Q13_02690 [Acidobacteriota bacterium]|nr:hypothetical protein [Acidobacteriota bacterium]
MRRRGVPGAEGLLLFWLLAVTGACAPPRPPVASPPATGPALENPAVIAQVLYRGEASSDQPLVLEHLADRGAMVLTGAPTPFEAWSALVDPATGVEIVHDEHGEALARAVARRIRLALGD